MKNYSFGKRLKYFREMRGMTQAALAEQINKSTHHITQMKRGLSLPSLPIFFDLCRVLEVPADYFAIDEDIIFAQNTIQSFAQRLDGYSPEELKNMAEILQIICHILKKSHESQDEPLKG